MGLCNLTLSMNRHAPTPFTILVVFLLALASPLRPQGRPIDASGISRDQLGLSCQQILNWTSTEWIEQFSEKTRNGPADPVDDQRRALAAYGACYDARTDALAASLARRGKGPTKAARADFASFESALKSFTAKALGDARAPSPSAKSEYANLYEKQFRREFYEEYRAKTLMSAPPSPTSAPANSAKPAATADSRRPAAPAAGAKAAPGAPATAEERARSDADPVTQAKNRFGEILDGLPDEQMHELHKAFGEVIEPYSISETTRLQLYRYAIFLLQPPSTKPFGPPPF